MARLKEILKLDFKDEIGVIRYLLDEIEEEKRYNEEYDKAYMRARDIAEKEGGYTWDYMVGYDHQPRQSVIKDDIKMIRRLALKIGLEAK